MNEVSHRRGNVFNPTCPSRVVLKQLTNSWGILVILALRSGTLRFSDIRRKVAGISEKMLAQTLKDLEKIGMLSRHSYNVVPPHVDYTLTPFGLEASNRLLDLSGWIEDRLVDILKLQQSST